MKGISLSSTGIVLIIVVLCLAYSGLYRHQRCDSRPLPGDKKSGATLTSAAECHWRIAKIARAQAASRREGGKARRAAQRFLGGLQSEGATYAWHRFSLLPPACFRYWLNIESLSRLPPLILPGCNDRKTEVI